MKSDTLFLPGFHLPTLRRKPRSGAQRLADERHRIRRHTISQLGDCFGAFIPIHELVSEAEGNFSRRRIFSKENTFWAFFTQVLDADGGCQEVVRKIQAFAAARAMPLPSASTSAYCQARTKLSGDGLKRILKRTSDQLQQRGHHGRWQGRRVVVVDGTGVSMPDTPDNQKTWPQPGSQKPGCGFPQARICACFCLQTGALLSYRVSSIKKGELTLLRQQWAEFKPGDIMMGDKGFCSYYDVCKFQEMGVDTVTSLARRTPVEAATATEALGPDDLLITWPKPVWNKNLSYSHEEWQALPDRLTLRQIKVTITVPGMRSESFYLVTTLTEASRYTAHELADLYFQRWNVELFFRDIKTTLGMDVLRCRSPEMVEKEILMHFIAYNAIRLLMVEAAVEVGQVSRRLSFKSSIQALRQWEPKFSQASGLQEQRRLLGALRSSIAGHLVPHRPGRQEPRCVKRRPKPFALLTVPRHQMIEIPHRGRYHANAA
jgi:Transposase DDE domain/Insertion element 4 transposase N-terminal